MIQNSFISWVGGKKALRHEIYKRFPKEYGRYIEYTDKVEDTSFLSVIKEFAPILGENMGAVLESINATELCSGTSVVYTNGAARSSVNTAITANSIKKAIRILEGNFAKKITKQNNPAKKLNGPPNMFNSPLF